MSFPIFWGEKGGAQRALSCACRPIARHAPGFKCWLSFVGWEMQSDTEITSNAATREANTATTHHDA